ncbi:DUF4407 domain-containing protein [Sinosporangium siamense]|uniref:DUF4407 domain-containing protein n=1 Tax=Sinosporangium siamense TaxID=1367973 RepID=A0A919RQ51_9ACTN|nr:DUF4407 domain-containing protein [Sinosporangium siamense]GII97227.1 hypothetical protein Ssi02_74580 [Sinosporangium siamense]
MFSSGADAAILDQCPTVERTRYAGLGGLVLTTAIMAGIAMTVALTLAFRAPLAVAVGAGALWCLIIFNLDRWLVSGYRPQTSRRGKIMAVGPRILLSVVLGLTISEPLVLLIFEPEIRAEAVENRVSAQNAADERIAGNTGAQRIEALRKEITDIRAQNTGTNPAGELGKLIQERDEVQRNWQSNEKALAEARNKAFGEGNGTAGSGVPGAGPRYEELRDDVATLDRKAADLKAEEAGLDRRIERARQAEETRVKEREDEIRRLSAAQNSRAAEQAEAIGRSDGLVARINALFTLGEKHTAVFLAHIVLALLILLIDLLPITGKILMSSGGRSSYDNLLAAREIEIAEGAALRVLEARERTTLATMRAGERKRAARDIARIHMADERYEQEQRSRRRRRSLDERVPFQETGEWNGLTP